MLFVPVDNGIGNVFVSLCIETNYNEPAFSDGGTLDPPLLTTVKNLFNIITRW